MIGQSSGYVPSASGFHTPTGFQANTQIVDTLPQAPAPQQQKFYTPGYDPTRGHVAGDFLPEGWLPNLQEALRPFTDPVGTAREAGGYTPSKEAQDKAYNEEFLARGLDPTKDVWANLGAKPIETLDALAKSNARKGESWSVTNVGGAAMNAFNLPSQLIQRGIGMTGMVSAFGAPKTAEESRQMWEAAQFGYADYMNFAVNVFSEHKTSRMAEAYAYMKSGMSVNDSLAKVRSEMQMYEHATDIVLNLTLDPLNLMGTGETGRLKDLSRARSQRMLIPAAEVLADASKGGKTLAMIGDVAKQVGAVEEFARKIPLVGGALGWLVKRTPGAEKLFVGEESAALIGNVLDVASKPETGAALRKLNIVDSPAKIGMALIENPDAVFKVGDEIVDTKKIVEIFGLGPRLLNEAEAVPLGLKVAQLVDPLRSIAANTTRTVMQNMEGGDLSKLIGKFEDMQKSIREVQETGKLVTKGGKTLGGGFTSLLGKGKFLTGEAQSAYQVGVVDAIGDFLHTLDGAVTKASGYVPPTGWSAKAYKGLQAVQGFMANFQLSALNPGHVLRNLIQNDMALEVRGVRAYFVNVDGVRKGMADYGFLSPAMARGFARESAEVGPQSFKLFGRWQTPLSNWNNAVESAAGDKALFSTYKTMFDSNWKVGKAIPDVSRDGVVGWDAIENTFDAGSVARLRTLVESAKTPEQLAAVADMLGRKLVITDPELVTNLKRLGIYDDIEASLRLSDNLDDALVELEKIHAQSAASLEKNSRLMNFRADSVGGELVDGMREAMGKSGVKGGAAFLDDFEKNLKVAQLKYQSYKTAANSAVEAMATSAEKDAMNQLFKSADLQYKPQWDQFFADNRYARELLKSGDVDGFVGAFPEVGKFGVLDQHSAWGAYSKWASGNAAILRDGENAIFEQVIRKSGTGVRIPDTSLFEKVVPLTKAAQVDAVSNIMSKIGEYGFNGKGAYQHFMNWMKKHKFLDKGATRFTASEVGNQEWVDKVFAKMRQHAPDIAADAPKWAEKEAAKGAAKVMPSLGKVPPLGDIPDTAHVVAPFDQMDHMIAAHTELRNVMDKTIAHLKAQDALPAVTEYSDTQRQVWNAFSRGLSSRMNETRMISERVAAAVRDEFLFNYGDRRNFDVILGMFSAYPYWHTRNLAGWAKQLIYSPGTVAMFAKIQAQIQKINQGLPEWWQDQITIQSPWGPLQFPLMRVLSPLNEFFGDKFHDPEAENTVYGQLIEMSSNQGFGPHAWISMTMALDARRRGDEDEALTWFSYLGAPTRAFQMLTAGIKQVFPDLPLIPPGGIALEPWLWQDGRALGSKYDARRIGRALGSEELTKQFTPEELLDAALYQKGPAFDAALQKSKLDSAGAVFTSLFLGTGFAMRTPDVMEMAQMDMQRRALLSMRDDPNVSMEEYRSKWRAMYAAYPYMDAVQMFSKDPLQRQEAYAWSVFNRLPPNSDAYLAALEGSDTKHIATMKAYLEKFYAKDIGFKGMSELEREDFFNTMKQLGGILALPSDAARKEWDIARITYSANRKLLDSQFGGDGAIFALEDGYFDTLKTQGYEAGSAFLEANPTLEEYWRIKNAMVTSDPLLAKYYTSLDTFERSYWADWKDGMEVKYPGVGQLFEEYYSLKDAGQYDEAKAFFKAHPSMKAYLTEKDLFTVGMRDKLTAMGDSIEALDPQFATLRKDFEATGATPGQMSVADLIKSGQRPMGDFVLPESLPARELQSMINIELNSLPPGGYGRMIRQLKQMGGLDKTLTAFQEFRNVATIQANETELRALLAAIAQIRENGGWKLLTTDSDLLQKSKSSGGGVGGGLVASKTYGGGATTVDNKKVRAYVDSLVQNYPGYYLSLRTMSYMTKTQLSAFLNDPLNSALRIWLDGEIKKPGFNMQQVMTYLAEIGLRK
jgi:phage terminase small subunit